MGRPIRDRNPKNLHLVTVRTEEARYYLRPSKDIKRIVAGVLARYQEILGITIYAFVIMSNHMHLLLDDPNANLDEFMENVDKEIARRVNFKLQRRGKFWSRRYRDQAVTNEKDLLEAYLYIITNPVKHGAVRHPSLWPGFSSYEQILSGKSTYHCFKHYSAKDDEEKETWHELKVSPLPLFKELSTSERQATILKLIEERTAKLVDKRTENGQGFMGPEAVKQVDPFDTPKNVNRTPTGNCYSKDADTILCFKKKERERVAAYREASFRFRLGDLTVIFPEFSFKPPLQRNSRITPFNPLPSDYLLQKVA